MVLLQFKILRIGTVYKAIKSFADWLVPNNMSYKSRYIPGKMYVVDGFTDDYWSLWQDQGGNHYKQIGIISGGEVVVFLEEKLGMHGYATQYKLLTEKGITGWIDVDDEVLGIMSLVEIENTPLHLKV